MFKTLKSKLKTSSLRHVTRFVWPQSVTRSLFLLIFVDTHASLLIEFCDFRSRTEAAALMTLP